MLNTLKKLCSLSGVSGSEEEVREYIAKQAAPYAQSIRTDALGNLIIEKKSANHPKGAPRLMICAHMDEVGFMVKAINSKGFVKFAPVGGIDPRVCFDRKVLAGPEKIPGIIGLKAVHMTPLPERSVIPSWDKMYIDIGAESKKEAEKHLEIGDVCTFCSEFVRFGENKDFIKAKAIDDRFGCAVMLMLLKEELPMDVSFVFTAMEEVGARGAFGAAFSLKPDIALILEGTTSADLAGVPPHKKVTTLGAGPVIGFMDGSTIYDRGLFEAIRDIADENGIPWQIKGRIAGGTDASSVQRSREGVRVASISLPVRSIHSPGSVARLSDARHCQKLAELFVKALADGRIRP